MGSHAECVTGPGTLPGAKKNERLRRVASETARETGLLAVVTYKSGGRLAAEADEQRQALLQRMRVQNHMRKHACVQIEKNGALHSLVIVSKS